MVDLEELERYRRRDSRTFAIVLEARFDEIAAELRQLRQLRAKLAELERQADGVLARLRAQRCIPSSALEAQMYEIERATGGGDSQASFKP